MSKTLDEVLLANESYVRGCGDKGKLALPPARRFAEGKIERTGEFAPLQPIQLSAVAANHGAPVRRTTSRVELVGLVSASLIAHGIVAARFARARSSEEPAREQQVEIEIAPPPLPPVHPPVPLPQAQRPQPVAKAVAARPRVVPKLDPPDEAPRETTDEAPELPVGDDGPSAESRQGGGVATTTVAPPAPVAVPAPVVQAREGANYLKNPRPAYPAIAMRRGWEGEIALRVQVAPDGGPLSVLVQRSSGHDVLDQAAVEAVRGWAFVPARQGGQPVVGWVNVPIVFRLQ